MAIDKPLHIVNTDRIDGHSVVVEFSDRTSITLTLADLVALRPDRSAPAEDATGGDDALHSAR